MKYFLYTSLFISLLSIFSHAQESDNWEWMNPKPQGNTINAIDFINDNIGYAAGTYGTILKTTDGGTEWKKLITNMTDPFLSLHFVSPETGFAGGPNQLLIKTVDGGTTWTNLQLPVGGLYGSSYYVRDIKFIDDQTGYVLGFFLMENKIWKTTDGGINWSTQTTGGANYLTELFFLDALNGYAAGGSLGGEIVKTTNGGATWQLVYQPDYQVTSLTFINSSTGFAGAEEGRVYKTTDGGSTWNSMWSETSLGINSLVFLNSTIGFGFGTGSVYTKTTDGGNYWYEFSLNIGSSRQYYDAEITPNGKIHAAGTYGAMIFSTDQGATFTSHPYVTEGYISDILFVSSDTGYAAAGYSGGDILKTTDAGNTWVSQITSYTLPIYGIAFTSTEIGYLAGSLKLYKTTNGGADWSVIYTSPYNDIFTDIFFVSESTGFVVGSYGKVLKTTDAGANWFSVSIPGSGILSSLYFIDENKGYTVGDNNAAYKTSDGGTNWFQMTVPSGNHNTIFFSSADSGYIASTTGIFRTTNSGQTWFTAGAPAGGYSNIQFRGSFGYAVTSGGKIIKSIDGGTNWFVQPTVTENGLYGLYFNIDNFIYVGGILGTMLKTMPTELLVVPVELTSFQASAGSKDITLHWSTSSESNNKGFEIEKSAGSGWMYIGYVPGAGTSTEKHNYFFEDNNAAAGKYLYRLKQIDYDGTINYSDPVEIEFSIPLNYSLKQNYPNPFNPSTTINYEIPVDAAVTLKVYDVTGAEIAVLVNERQQAGRYNIKFNADNLSSGIYFYKIQAGNFLEIKKMILLR